MAVCYSAVFGCLLGHVAVRAGEEGGMLAARAEISFKLGMLHLDHLDAGAGVGPVGESLAGGEIGTVVEVGQHCLRGHALQTVVRDGCRLGLGLKVVLVVALAAGEICGCDLVKVLADRVDPVGVGHGDLAGSVRVAAVAADAFRDLGLHFRPVLLVGFDALFIHHVGKVGCLAGPAVGQRVRPSGSLDVLDIVEVAAGGAIVDGKAVALIQGAEIRILFQVIYDLIVLTVLKPGFILIGELFFPIRGMHDGDAGFGLYLLGRIGRVGRRGKREKQHKRQKQRQGLLHEVASFFIQKM